MNPILSTAMSDPSKEFSLRGGNLILSAAILWGTTGTAQALGPAASHPFQVGALRLIVAAIALGTVAWASQSSGSGSLRRPATLVAALAMAAYQPAFFVAVERLGVAVGTLLALGSAPLFAGAIQAGVESIRPTRRWLAASGVAIAGLVLLTDPAGAGLEPVGVTAALAAGFAYATFASAAARLRRVAPGRAMATVFALAAVLALPLLGTADLAWATSGPGLAMVGWLGVVATAAAYLLYAAGLRTVDVNRAATLSLAEPVTATLLGVLFLGERPGVTGAIGAALIVGALAALVRPPGLPSILE